MFVGRGSVGIEINFWNPFYALAPFFLLSISIPLAFFAIITASIAISLLFARAAVVYVQLVLAVTGAWISPSKPKPNQMHYPTPPKGSPVRTPADRHRSSSNAASTVDNTGPAGHSMRLSTRPVSLTTLPSTSEIIRDFEGVGGWRAPGDEDEEALWMGMNSRLHLPIVATPRRHQRSLTGGSSPGRRRSSEALRMSPVQSRVKMRLVDDEEDYFSPQSTQHRRRKSCSGSSSSSATSGLVLAVKKEVGE